MAAAKSTSTRVSEQPALARREAESPARGGRERQRAPVGGQLQAGGDLGQLRVEQRPALGSRDRPVAVRVEALDLLEGRDLRLVEDVVDATRPSTIRTWRELVDGEVPERMGERRRGSSHGDRGQRRERGERGRADGRAHRRRLQRPPRARRVERVEARALRDAGARAGDAPAPAAPARRAIIPAW